MANSVLSSEEESNLYTGGHSPLCRNPIHCIVPPHILEAMAKTGNEQRRAVALETLSITESFKVARIGKTHLRGLRRALQRARLFGRQRRALLSVQREGRVAAALEFTKYRIIYDAQNTRRLPGVLVREEGQGPTGDQATDEAYEGLGATFDLYADVYGRNSIDDNGMELDATVHYRKNYDNAFWDGQRMIFGDGDGDVFNRFTIVVDIMGHELTHGVTQYDCGLQYWKQSGALNESISDVFGSLVKQYSLNRQTADQADWLIGQGLLTNNVNGVALRSMKAPGTAYDDPVFGGKDPQPAYMRDYVDTAEDSGGVHINSGIPNHAFYLAAVAIGGYAWEKAGLIWYLTLPSVPETAQFQDFANLTLDTAQRLYEVNSPEYEAVGAAWTEVGVL